MNNRIIIILGIILALHILLVYLIFSGRENEITPEKISEDQKNELITKPEDKKNPLKNNDEIIDETEVSIPQTRKNDSGSEKKSLNYNEAVKGNIPSISGTKNAAGGILIDWTSKKVLWAKNPHKSIPIASITKIMTALTAMEIIEKDPQITLNTVVQVSKSASKIGGRQVWLDPREAFSLRNLMRSLLIHSANDSAYLVAEYLAGGNADEFIKKMNKKAKSMGLNKTEFHNPHGLDNGSFKTNRSSPENLAFIAGKAIKNKQIMAWTAVYFDNTNFRKGKTHLTSPNKLLESRGAAGVEGVDGLKTGYTKKAGSCIIVSCKRRGDRIIAVVLGMPSSKERNKLCKKLLEWAYKKI